MQKKRSPASNNCHPEFHNGGSKPFSKSRKAKKAAASAVACSGISPKGCERAAVQCMLSRPGSVEVFPCRITALTAEGKPQGSSTS